MEQRLVQYCGGWDWQTIKEETRRDSKGECWLGRVEEVGGGVTRYTPFYGDGPIELREESYRAFWDALEAVADEQGLMLFGRDSDRWYLCVEDLAAEKRGSQRGAAVIDILKLNDGTVTLSMRHGQALAVLDAARSYYYRLGAAQDQEQRAWAKGQFRALEAAIDDLQKEF